MHSQVKQHSGTMLIGTYAVSHVRGTNAHTKEYEYIFTSPSEEQAIDRIIRGREFNNLTLFG